MSEIKSPCISVCALDENDVCFGCYRTANEITNWSVYSDEEKRDVLALSIARQNDSQTVKLGE